MAKKTEKRQPAENESVSQAEVKSQKKIKNKKYYLTLIIVLAIAVVIYALLIHESQLANQDVVRQADGIEFNLEAQELEESGQIDDALAVYREGISQTEDQEQQAELYIAKARIMQREGSLEQALVFTKRSLELNQTFNGLTLAGALYKQLGSIDKAISNYQSAIDKLNESSEVIDVSEINALESIIAELREDKE